MALGTQFPHVQGAPRHQAPWHRQEAESVGSLSLCRPSASPGEVEGGAQSRSHSVTKAAPVALAPEESLSSSFPVLTSF